MKKSTIVSVIVLLAVLSIVILTYGEYRNVAIYSSDDDTFYQYSGTTPTYKQKCGNFQSGGCASYWGCYPDKAVYDAKIVFSNLQSINNINGNNYDFIVANVQEAKSPSSTCAGITYSVAVQKNGIIIDSINVQNPSSCDQIANNWTITKIYDNVIEATFGFDGNWREGQGDYNCQRGAYIINRYEILESNLSMNVEVTPDNTQLVELDEPIKNKVYLAWLDLKTASAIILVILFLFMIYLYRRKK